MKRILLILSAAVLMLGTACGKLPKPVQQTGVSENESAEDTAAADTTDTGEAGEQTAPVTEQTADVTGTEAETEADVPAETTFTTRGIGQSRTPLPDTSALDQEIQQYKRGCAVLLESLDGTVLYSYHPDTLIPGASLIKLPYVYYCCTQIDAGEFKLTDTMTYTAEFRQGGSGVVRESAVGTEYTLKQLMEYSLKYSDNTAYYMLVSKFGARGFNQMTADWGHGRIKISVEKRFPSVTATFMRAAMKKMYQKRGDGECWENAWNALVNSERSYAREIIGGTNDIAVKYGSIEKQYHETVLADGDRPYILVLLSGAVDYDPDEQFVKNVIADAKAIAEEYNSQQ